jgi:hypothetical protein
MPKQTYQGCFLTKLYLKATSRVCFRGRKKCLMSSSLAISIIYKEKGKRRRDNGEAQNVYVGVGEPQHF